MRPPRMLVSLVALSAGAAAAAEVQLRGALSEGPPAAAPFLSVQGPYGSPLRLRPPLSPLALSAGWSGRAAPISAPPAPTTAAEAVGLHRPQQEGAEPAAPRPGMFEAAPVQIPEIQFPEAPQAPRSRGIAPHVKPDVEIAVGRRTSLGMFGEVGKVEVDTRGLLPLVRPRDVNAGVTFQYRFGE